MKNQKYLKLYKHYKLKIFKYDVNIHSNDSKIIKLVLLKIIVYKFAFFVHNSKNSGIKKNLC